LKLQKKQLENFTFEIWFENRSKYVIGSPTRLIPITFKCILPRVSCYLMFWFLKKYKITSRILKSNVPVQNKPSKSILQTFGLNILLIWYSIPSNNISSWSNDAAHCTCALKKDLLSFCLTITSMMTQMNWHCTDISFPWSSSDRKRKKIFIRINGHAWKLFFQVLVLVSIISIK